MTGELRVEPQALQNTATEFNGNAQSTKATTDAMLQMVKNLASHYEGEAAEAYFRQFQALEGDMQQIYNRIQEHSTDLTEMASAYISTENVIVTENAALKSDYI